jgi:hypothetical protein
MSAETLDNLQHSRRHKSPMKNDSANELNSESGVFHVPHSLGQQVPCIPKEWTQKRHVKSHLPL